MVLWHAPDYFCVQLQNNAWNLKDPNLCVLGEGCDRVWFVTPIHCSCLTLNLSVAFPQAAVWHREDWEEGEMQFSVVVTAQSWPLVTCQFRPTCCEVVCLEALVRWMFGVGLTQKCTLLKISIFLAAWQGFSVIHFFPEFTVMRNLSVFCLSGQARQWQPAYTENCLYVGLGCWNLCSKCVAFVIQHLDYTYCLFNFFVADLVISKLLGAFYHDILLFFPHLFRLKHSVYDKKLFYFPVKHLGYGIQPIWQFKETASPKEGVECAQICSCFLLGAPAKTLLTHQV